jgi:hypothetical protein
MDDNLTIAAENLAKAQGEVADARYTYWARYAQALEKAMEDATTLGLIPYGALFSIKTEYSPERYAMRAAERDEANAKREFRAAQIEASKSSEDLEAERYGLPPGHHANPRIETMTG